MGGLLLLVVGWCALPVALPDPPQRPVVLDRHGVVIAEPGTGQGVVGAPIERLPEPLRLALLAAEDHRYGKHPGVDPIAVLRAARANQRAGDRVQGGSTLAMQLARNLWPRPPGLRGKLWEAAWALRLNAQLGDQLLVEYANRVYFGHQAWGVDAASRVYFDSAPSRLSVAQAAMLAGLVQRPSELDPFRAPKAALARRDRVLDRMLTLGFLSPVEHQAALAEPLRLQTGPPAAHAPHFVQRLSLQPGDNPTTLDLGIQLLVEELLSEHLSSLQGRQVDQAAAIVLDTQSSQVLAYVGSAGWDSPDGQVDGANAPRSPGSTLKPFLYQQALQRQDITLATLLDDAPGTWSNSHGSWQPRNYDERDLGPLRARVALATSRNLPAVRLLEEVGLASFHTRLQALGMAHLDKRAAHYGLGLVLGAGEVTLSELAAAYATLGRQGVHKPLQLQPTEQPAPQQIGTPASWFLVQHALDDPDARAPAFGADSALEPEFPWATKTGTSVGWRDNWAVGVSPRYVVAVWVGNFDGRPMVQISGVSGAAPLMRAIAERLHGPDTPAFKRPPGVVRAPICLPSGMAPSPECPRVRSELFLAGTIPLEPDDWWVQAQIGADGSLATGCPSSSPTLLLRYPTRYRSWAQATGQDAWPTLDRSCVDTSAPQQASLGRITSPAPDAVFYLESDRPLDQQALHLRAAVDAPAPLEWYVDQELLASAEPHRSTRWIPSAGPHTITLRQSGAELDQIQIWVGRSQESP
ncbi:MAG: penicillin-binding protein 1C [Myxococcota bacterium]|nr:penicillin-binding protein 1C [Myxococcota bacterium]